MIKNYFYFMRNRVEIDLDIYLVMINDIVFYCMYFIYSKGNVFFVGLNYM